MLNNCFFQLIYQEISRDNFFEYKNQKIKPEKLLQTYSQKYSDAGKRTALLYLLNYYNENNKSKYIKSLLINNVDFDENMFANVYQLNSFAWSFFEKYDDTFILYKALSWSKKSIEQDEKPMYLDTYANLLYKLGQKEDAIKYEEKAITLLNDEKEIKTYTEVLEKMKKGEKTWK